MATVTKKSVLITGCSTGGIGWAVAKTFHRRGFYVFATARNLSRTGNLAELRDIEILELDVTLPKTIAQCKEIVTRRTGGRLDVLVNNAGIEFNSPLLDTDIDEAKELFDVNVWGPLAMVQAFAPLLIEAKGVVLNQSSIDGALNMVWAGKLSLHQSLQPALSPPQAALLMSQFACSYPGIFASSKSAAARMSETLRLELEPLGVRVVTSVCGSADTPMFGKPGGPMELPETSYYRGVEEEAWKERMDHQRQAMDVDVLAGKLVKDILRGTSGAIWHGAFASLVWWASWFNVTWFVDRMINSARGLNKVRKI
jgi:1-acylglycerone phosphate reductase